MAKTFYIDTALKMYSFNGTRFFTVDRFKAEMDLGTNMVTFNELEDAIGNDVYSTEVMAIDVVADTINVNNGATVFSPNHFTPPQLVAYLQSVFPPANSGNGGSGVTSVAGRTGDVTLSKSDVGLSNVPNLVYSGSNTGDETQSSINTKIGYTPANAATAATLSGSETLTNKTINAANNTISNVPYASIDLSNPDLTDASNRTKIAPFVGGRTRLDRSIGIRTLAHFAAKADVNGTNAALADVTAADAMYGTTANTLTSVIGTTYTFAPASVNAVVTDVTDGIIRFWFKPIANIYSNIDKFSIELHSTGTPSSPSSNYHAVDAFDSPSDFKQRMTATDGTGRWQSFSIAANQFAAVGTGATLTAITYARLVLRSKTGGASMQIAIGNIEFVPNKLTKAKCILGFDDGFLSQYTYVAPLLAKYGFRGVIYPGAAATTIGADNSTYMTAQQVKNLHDNLGWQVASQAWTTEIQVNVDAWSETQFTNELSKLRNWQLAMGLTGGEDGSYFSNVDASDMIAYPTFRKHFRTMRAYEGGNGSGAPLYFGETFPWGDAMRIRALSAASYSDAAAFASHIQLHIDQAISNKGVAMIIWHNELASAGNFRTAFVALLTYLDTHRSTIDVVNVDDLYR